MKDFYLGDSKCYFLEDILDSESLKKKILFTTSKDVFEIHHFTGKVGFEDVYLGSKDKVYKLSDKVFEIPKYKCSRLDLGHYRHFKGGEYLVLGVALELGSRKEHVIYESLCNNGKIFARERHMFLEIVASKEYNYFGPRFKLVAKE